MDNYDSYKLICRFFEQAEYKNSLKSYVDFLLEFIEIYFGFKKSMFKLISANFDDMSVISSRGISKKLAELSTTRVGLGISGKVALRGSPLIVNDISKNEGLGALRNVFKSENIHSMISIPVATSHEIIGVINIYEESSREFENRDLFKLMSILNLAANFIKVLKVKENANDKLRRLERYCSSLEREKSFHESIMESIPIGIVATDVRGYVVLMNRVLEEMSLLSRQECLGKRWFEVFGFEGEVRKKLELSFRTSSPQFFPLIDLPLKNGTVLPVEMKTDIIRNRSGDTIGVVAICSNIEEKRKIEQEIEKIERLVVIGKLSAGIAHEIRNPLAGISGVIQVLKEKFVEDSELIRIFDRVSIEIDRLDGVVEKLNRIAFTKKLSYGLYNINEIIEDCLFFIRSSLKDRGIDLIKRLEGNLGSILVDRDAIYQVLLNILINAMHAMPNGGKLKVETKLLRNISNLGSDVFWISHMSLEKAKGEEPFICISVSDDGVSIPKAILPKIFDAFFSTFKGGTGLGLYVSAKIIEQHKGLLGVFSEKGKGSVFYILLPLKIKE